MGTILFSIPCDSVFTMNLFTLWRICYGNFCSISALRVWKIWQIFRLILCIFQLFLYITRVHYLRLRWSLLQSLLFLLFRIYSSLFLAILYSLFFLFLLPNIFLFFPYLPRVFSFPFIFFSFFVIIFISFLNFFLLCPLYL